MTEPIFVILFVIDVLDRLGIAYFIGGSFASVAYGHVRTTQDVDIVAYIETSHVDVFVKAVELDFYVDRLMVRDAISRRSRFSLIHLRTAFKVDIFLPKNRPFDQQQLARRVKQVIDKETSREVYFASLEDTILAKLDWYRLGGEESEVQWRDIQGILRQRFDQLDIEYLKDSAEAMNISDLLERSLEEARL